MQIPNKAKIETCRAVEIVSAAVAGASLFEANALWEPLPLLIAGIAFLAVVFASVARDQFTVQSIPEPDLRPHAPQHIAAMYDGGMLAVQELAETVDIIAVRFRENLEAMLVSHKLQADLTDERDHYRSQAARLNQIRDMADVDGYRREPTLYAIPSRQADPPMPRDLDEPQAVVPFVGRS